MILPTISAFIRNDSRNETLFQIQSPMTNVMSLCHSFSHKLPEFTNYLSKATLYFE